MKEASQPLSCWTCINSLPASFSVISFLVGSVSISECFPQPATPPPPNMTSVTKPLWGFIFTLAVLFRMVRLVSFP